MKYVIYKRVSTREQGKSGLGLEAQSRDIDLFLTCLNDEPYTILGEFVDVESGKNDDRVELGKAMDLARKERATLLVSKLDRLSRDVVFIATLLKDKRLAFRVASMPHADKFQLHIYAALAEQEREFISARTKAALAAAGKRGVKLGGLRDSTMRRNEVVKAQADDRAARLASIVVPLREHGGTLDDIANALNAAGMKAPRGGSWQATQVARVLARLQAPRLQPFETNRPMAYLFSERKRLETR